MALDFNFDYTGYSDKEREYLYRDVNIMLAKDTTTNTLIMREDLSAVYRSLHNIFTWYKGTRPTDPDFGIPLEIFLGDLNNTATYNKIVKNVKAAIVKYEPRVRVNKVTVASLGDHEIAVKVAFSIPTLDDEIYEYAADLKR